MYVFIWYEFQLHAKMVELVLMKLEYTHAYVKMALLACIVKLMLMSASLHHARMELRATSMWTRLHVVVRLDLVE